MRAKVFRFLMALWLLCMTSHKLQFVRAGIVLVIVCSFFRSCSPSPSLNSEVENENEASQSTPNDCVLTTHEKWVMKSYFDTYGTLDDVFFRSFKKKEFTPCMCKADEDNPDNTIKLSGLERHLIGEGSHRRLLTSIWMDMQDGPKDPRLLESCEVIIIERLPIGVFADPFELQHMCELGVYSDVAVFGDTNLELPSFLSSRSAVEIHIDSAFGNTSTLDRSNFQINVAVPLHTRYPALNKAGYSSVQFRECDVLVRCSPKSNLRRNPCLSIFITGADKPGISRLVWKIPAGIATHAGFVSNFTFLAAAFSSITIILSSLFSSGK